MRRAFLVVVVLLLGATGLVFDASEAGAQGVAGATSLERRCPTGYIEIPGDDLACLRFEFAPEGDPVCPSGAEGLTETGCYIFYGEPVLNCPIDGVAVDGTCLQVVDLAPVCPTQDSCFEVVDKVTSSCPGLAVLVPVTHEPGFECRVVVDLIADQLKCQAGFALLQDECFLRLAPGPGCVDGLALIDGFCHLRGEPPVLEPPFCPQSTQIVQDGCYRLVSPIYECPADSFEEAASTRRCLREVAPLVDDFICSVGEQLLDGQCLAQYDPAGPFACDGEYLAGMCVAFGPPPQLAGSLVPIGAVCEAGYTAVVGNSRCAAVAGVAYDPGALQCTEYALVDELGNCRRPVANARVFVCDDPDSWVLGNACAWAAAPRIWCEGLPDFSDVRTGALFEDPVGWAACVGVTRGTSDTTFSPGDTLTRAQMATLLWRYAGAPTDAPAHGFSDVAAGAYFDEAVAWLKHEGITTGTSPTTFSPDAAVTRAQMAAFLWRMQSEPAGAGHSFVDVPAGEYFDAAVGWMAGSGITTGTSPSTFSPQLSLTRAQAVTFLWRLAGEPG